MMNPRTSQLHGLVHIVMVILIVGLLSLYLQLRVRFTDLSHTCQTLKRNAKKSLELEGRCAGILDQMNSHGCFQDEDPPTATSAVVLDAPPRPKSEASLTRADRFLQTDSSTHKLVSISVSESFFDSKHTPFKTSGALTVDETGKTVENFIELIDESTVSSTDVDSASQISHVELTNAKLHEFLKSQDSQQKSQTIQASVNFLPFKPSSTLEKQIKRKQDNVYSQYNNMQHPLQDETTPESVFVSEAALSSSVTDFSPISLPVSETSKEVVNLVKKISLVEVQDFGPTYLDSYRDSLFLKTISSTESACADSGLDPGYGCQSEDPDGCSNIEESRLQIEPIPPEAFDDHCSFCEPCPGLRYSEKSNADHEEMDPLLKPADARDIQALLQKGTSADCGSLHSDGTHTCHFENLCYKVKEHDFIFLKGEHSIINRQLSLNKMDSDDLFDISLSIIPDHNHFKFSPVFLPSHGLNKFSSVAILQGKSFILHRFKPDNIMHVLHDDILPLHHTLKSLGLIHGHTKPKLTLLLADQFSIGEYANLYQSLSNITPVSLWDVNYVADIICFEDTYIGMSNSTLWYQYGFFQLQGPLNANVSNVVHNIRSSVRYLNEHFNYECMLCTSKNYIILLSRKDNRLILNEGEIMLALARSTKLKVMSVSMETHSLEEIISLVRSSRGIIGMHGSLLSFIIFLQPGTFVIELFPYAVNPSKYTPFKTFSDLTDSGIIYKSWANQDRDKSIPHPDWPAEMGGIHHLSHDTQEMIIDQSEVPEHLCCEDSSWLYHIYQDTEVDIDEVITLTNQALLETNSINALKVNSKPSTELLTDIPIIPGPVRNFFCKITNDATDNKNYIAKYLLIWEIPWNLEFFEYRNLEFQLVISEAGNDTSVNVNLPFNVTFYSLEPVSEKQYVVYNVWVRVTVDKNNNGPYGFVTCKNNI